VPVPGAGGGGGERRGVSGERRGWGWAAGSRSRARSFLGNPQLTDSRLPAPSLPQPPAEAEGMRG
jgi:hypothetical protein